MTRALIVSTARTGLAKSFRGGFNLTHGAALGGHAIKSAIARAGIEPGAVEDVILGCGMPEAETGMNIARNAAMWAGCPVTTSGTTVNRFCSSGLQAVAMAAQAILVDGTPCAIGGGLDSISLVQPKMVKGVVVDKPLMKAHPALWMPMIDTADIVASRYGVKRETLDEYALRSQQRTWLRLVRDVIFYSESEIASLPTVPLTPPEREALVGGGAWKNFPALLDLHRRFPKHKWIFFTDDDIYAHDVYDRD